MKYFGLACIISLVITGLAYTKGGWELASEANAWPGESCSFSRQSYPGCL